ncbi:MAG: hypothetical protein KAS32_03085 [Candidatus Peribacteraceae bacterium]|nr:hypothetical protein [Candidatus Peribacteraceae bacterium]
MKLTFIKRLQWYYPHCQAAKLIVLDIAKRTSLKQNEIDKLEAVGFVIERIEE